jgi:UDP-glucose 4-epimerase
MSSLPTIALTGATGFIGSYLLGELTRRGHPVRVLLRRPTALPANCTNAVIGDLSRPINMAAALAEVDTVIHSAGLAPRMSGTPDDDFRRLNAEATANLARAAQQARVRRFIFLSSVRAQSDISTAHALREDAPAVPTDSYGRSKLAAENELARLAIDWVALRLALVFGPGVKGNMAALIRLARSPLWLPFGALAAPRSLLALENLTAAVELAISVAQPLRRPLIVADPDPLTVPQIVAALRAGLGRPPGLIAVPTSALRLAFRLARREQLYRRLAEPLVADPAALLALGWTPRIRTPDALAAVAQSDAL